MRWKITGQILGLLAIVLPVMYVSLLVFGVLLFGRWGNLSGAKGLLSNQAGQMTLDFEPNLQYEDGQFSVEPQKLDELRKLGVWLQVLDENGSEVYQQFKPASAPTHYTPAELILDYRYSGAIKDETQGYTIYVARATRGERTFSYILGFSDREVIKTVLAINPLNFVTNIARVLIGAVVIVTLVILVLAYFYGSHLARPLADIIEGIQRLARSDYAQGYRESGVYAPVFGSLNKLAGTLQSNEAERKQLETAREEWIANVSHDVKTPLSSLKGYAELLAELDYHFEEDEVRKYAHIIVEKSVYMDRLIEDLRLTYRLKNAALPLEKQRLNLVSLLREAVIDLLNDPRYSSAPLHFEPCTEEVWFAGDARLLQRAFTNLMLNALVHNPPGTPVNVSIEGGERIRIIFQDRGQGIPPDEVQRLFERYYRGTNTGEAHKGSGLGMAIARQVIEAHGGSVTVESKPGQGTRIALQLTPAG